MNNVLIHTESVNAIFYVQLQARRIHRCIYPENYPLGNVCSEYLGGLSEECFWKACCELRRIFINYYKQAENDPASLNLPLHEIEKYKNTSAEARAGNAALLNFPIAVFAVALCTSVSGYVLTADIAELRRKFTELKGKYLPEQLKLLTDYGFSSEGFNGKLPKSGELIIDYPDNPGLLIVLTALGDKLNKYMPWFLSQPKSCYGLNLLEQFIFLTPGVFMDNTELLPPKTLDHMSNVVKDDVLFKIVSEFEKRGLTLQFDTAFLKNRFINQKGKDTLNFIEYGDYKSIYPFENESLVLRLKLNNLDAYMEKIQALPPHLVSAFTDIWCVNCAEKCNRKIVYQLNGEEKCACGCFFFGFKNPSADDVDRLMELYELEQNARVKR